LDVQDGDWGIAQGGLNLVNMFMDGGGEVADYQCRQILRDQYFRLQPMMRKSISLDNWQAADELIKIADEINLEPLLDWIDRSF
jgi:hypothetical protein